MMEVKPENYFWLRDGRALKDLHELSDAFEKMHDDIFKHHVNNEKNDFANWIRDIIKDEKLAEKIIKCSDRHTMHQAIKEKLTKKEQKYEIIEKQKEVKDITLHQPRLEKSKLENAQAKCEKNSRKMSAVIASSIRKIGSLSEVAWQKTHILLSNAFNHHKTKMQKIILKAMKKSKEKRRKSLQNVHPNNSYFDLEKPMHKIVFWMVLVVVALVIILSYITK